jgi:16S rRNA (adenine1518-N6/adenine1519-N6)-dimethyltransferase
MTVPKKSLGQNFLMHAQTAERIVGAARLPEDATVLEIGPGTGMLTKALLSEAGKVIAVEADDLLAEELPHRFASDVKNGKLEVLHEDIREFDTAQLPDSYHIVANIPYYITGEIIRQFLTAAKKPQSMTLLVQKEVAERIARNQGKASLLSLSVEAFGIPEFCFTVPRGAFRPSPTVDSAVLSIRKISEKNFESNGQEATFFNVLRTGFAHKRKKLAKNLEDIAPADRVKGAFAALGLDPNVRSEDLKLADWLKLAQAIGSEELAGK